MLHMMVTSEVPWANVMLNFNTLEKYLDIYILYQSLSPCDILTESQGAIFRMSFNFGFSLSA